ncbi:MAG: prolipoprotein diacylglyceryl transferase [Candidatus Omnitrophota bacterium]
MYPILFKIGPITIYTYGVCVFLGVVAGYLVGGRLARKEGLDGDVFSNILFWALIWGFLGARVFYVLVEWRSLLDNPIEVIFSRSGFVFYGGVIFGLGYLYLTAKKQKINFLKLADILVVSLPLAHAFGRIGCFFYGCCYGSVLGIPVQLVSSGFLLLLFCLLLFLKKKAKFTGQITAYYLIFYGIFRFIIEFSRTDPRGQVLFLSTSQFISLILMVGGIFLFWKFKKR